IHNKPVALNLLISYCKQQDLKLLKELYFQFDQLQETANIAVLEAFHHQVNLYLHVIFRFVNNSEFGPTNERSSRGVVSLFRKQRLLLCKGLPFIFFQKKLPPPTENELGD